MLLSLMARRAEEQSQLQLVEREDIDDEEDLFESIDKRTILDSFLSNFWIGFSFSVYSHVAETESLKLIFYLLLSRCLDDNRISFEIHKIMFPIDCSSLSSISICFCIDVWNTIAFYFIFIEFWFRLIYSLT